MTLVMNLLEFVTAAKLKEMIYISLMKFTVKMITNFWKR